MSDVRTITYDDKTAGRKVLAFPPELPFLPHLEELVDISTLGQKKDSLLHIASSGNIYECSRDLGSFISLSDKPFLEVLRIAAIAFLGEPGGLKLLYTLFMAIPQTSVLVEEISDFRNTKRVMERIAAIEKSGEVLQESEEWFKKKVMLLSSTFPLPGASAETPEKPWLSWSEGVRRAVADPDDRWESAIMERAKIELEAREMRIRNITTSLDVESRHDLAVSLGAQIEEIIWKKRIIEETSNQRGSSTLLLKRAIGAAWDDMISALRGSKAGSLLADMFEIQLGKVHSYPQLKNGTAIMRGLLLHPALRKTNKDPDILSCMHLFMSSAGKGVFQLMMPIGKKLTGIDSQSGFSLDDRLLTIDLNRLFSGHFVDENDTPLDPDWIELSNGKQLSYKSLVMTYMDNDTFLCQLLNNPKATNKPGIVDLIAQRCRSLRVLSLIANRRDLHTGFTNKNVPMHLLMNPSKIPLTTIRKFIHIRYVDKMTLVKLATKGGGNVREEVRREIERYNRSSN